MSAISSAYWSSGQAKRHRLVVLSMYEVEQDATHLLVSLSVMSSKNASHDGRHVLTFVANSAGHSDTQ